MDEACSTRVAQSRSVKPRPGLDSRWPGCCGLTGVCMVTDESFCMYVNHKRRRDRIWAALAKCTVCGGGENATRHLSIHPDCHPFTTEDASA